MTLSEIKNEVMFQTNNDVDDLGDFLPYLLDYINEGYDRIVYAWARAHLNEEWPALMSDEDTPLTPDWTHRALADWATWLVYRNGNPQKQNRGIPFRNAFDEILGKIMDEGGINGRRTRFFNIPK